MIRESAECDMFKFVKLGKKLGEGAYGQVYQALSTKDHKFIVVKKIPVPEHITSQKSK
jgi:serine/threonine protein kinase